MTTLTYPLQLASSSSTFSEEAVVAYCRSPSCQQVLGVGPTSLAKINQNTVVKFGQSVFAEEFRNQDYAYHHLDSTVVRVPKPVQFFKRDLCGFLVMEWLELASVERIEAVLTAVARAVQHVHSVLAPSDADVGPIGGGCCRGDRFNEDVEFDDKSDLQHFLNYRLRNHRWTYGNKNIIFDLHNQPLVLAHLDLAARNLGRTQDGTICILDWAMAGFFPRWFDHAMLEACRDGLDGEHEVNLFKTDLLLAMDIVAPLSTIEKDMKDSLIQVMDNCHCIPFHAWGEPSPPPRPRKKKKKKGDSILATLGMAIVEPSAIPVWDLPRISPTFEPLSQTSRSTGMAPGVGIEPGHSEQGPPLKGRKRRRTPDMSPGPCYRLDHH